MSRSRKPDLPAGPDQALTGRTKQFLQMDFLEQDPGQEELTSLERLRGWCFEALEGKGKIAGLVAASRVAAAFATMDRSDRDAFHVMLERHFSVDPAQVAEAIDGYRSAEGSRAQELARLTRAVDSPRLHLFRQFNTIPHGIKFVVDLRADVSARVKVHPDLWLIEFELRHLLESWFNVGFLRLARITWESPAALLEKLVEYEAVHAIDSWRALKRRLQADRACYAYIHRSMPTEPVIFVEVALVHGLAGKIHDLIDPKSRTLEPQQADTAIFYSITNAQRGLRGIAFGNLLIKQVTARLRSELPNLQTFATLSPIPRFREEHLRQAVEDESIAKSFTDEEAAELCGVTRTTSVGAAVSAALSDPRWPRNESVSEALRPGLLRAARSYLTLHQRRGRVACPVGHFHGSNGAKLGRINWLGDRSANGMSQSAGMMVNYLYEPEMFDHYQAEYTRTGRLPVHDAVQMI